MTAGGRKNPLSLGFLTIREHADQGYLGGYLVLNSAGRPLEFHCTVPIRPNRAQEILYGPTLKPFVYGEQIGQTLLEKARNRPLFVCTDVEPALAVQEHTSLPVVLVEDRADSSADAVLRVDSDHPVPAPSAAIQARFQLGTNRVTTQRNEDRDRVLEQWKSLPDDFDLAEPFKRIHEAIEEAQRGAAGKA